ncbi:hypothetical protein [Paenibacillus endoradicis]|uniref:hypothetical protein n=1 Tax=Paenibacillus endoradicis TaxID=2972487 RepID=UPI0021596D75|nr:hypothetical protein [Paenibacillus endoradicis]MCR8656231.1 hypothetical protein [Paenibacillus endoradicis]
MKQITINKWVIEYDEQRTNDFYKSHYLITEGCSCLNCKNFVKAVEVMPEGIISFLKKLGIDPRKGEVSAFCENEDDTHLYGGFYHIVGKLISGPDCWIKTVENELTHAVLDSEMYEVDGIIFGFTYGVSLLPTNFPEPALQIEFQGNIPWVLSEKP